MGATTSADAEMYQKAAEDEKATAEAQATDAGMYYMAAMDAAAAAEMAAGTHALGLFTSANAYDVTDEKAAAAEVKSVGAAIAAAAMATDGTVTAARKPPRSAVWADRQMAVQKAVTTQCPAC